MPLIVTFEPKQDESGRGYYRRLSCDNGLGRVAELARMASVAPNAAALMRCPEHVASELDLDPQWARQACAMEKRAASWGTLRRLNTEAVCPCCLVEDVYVRESWGNVFVTACPKHGCGLLDRCPDCGELLSTNRQCIERCECGLDLRTVSAPSCSPARLWLSSLIASDGQSTASVAPLVQNVAVSKVTGLVRDLCRAADPAVPAIHKARATAKTTAEAIEFLAPLDLLLENWPVAFRAHASARIKAGNPDARTLNKLLGKWYKGLRKTCLETPLQPFLEIVLEVAAAEFDGVILMDSAGHVASHYSDSVLCMEAAKRIGVDWGFLRNAFLAGKCAYYMRRLGTRGGIYEVPKCEIERIRSSRAEWIKEDEACTIAQVTPAVLRLMMEAGVIENDRGWRNDILKAGPIRKASLEDLCTKLCGKGSTSRRVEAGHVYWSDMSFRRLGDKHAIQSAMRAAASGELIPVVRGKHLGEVGFSKTDLARYNSRHVLEQGVTVNQLAKETGWKWESISHWIDAGLLESPRDSRRLVGVSHAACIDSARSR